MATIFEKIIAREILAQIVYEDERTIAFLDIAPVSRGHTLVVPKTVVDQIDDLSENDYQNLMLVSRRIARNLRVKLAPLRIGRLVYGLDVPHVHIHLIPLYTGKEMQLENKGEPVESTELLATLQEVKIS
ncbi:HIT family protein [Candidatus Saccharibacteria bacterium]|jgi:histidine triad (HIT) family protein|nr:HIT family protein [Candidatus Saccharibacteria bacterium]